MFRRGIGEATEVVGKEMYEFDDRGGRRLALRPEGTAPVVRAFVQHHPATPWKAWYVTPAFRYEQPQAGRYRQHHQVGVEALGTDDPDLDVEVIALAQRLLSRARAARGHAAAQLASATTSAGPAYLDAAARVPRPSAPTSCATSTASTWRRNPLRVLDCKTRAVPRRPPRTRRCFVDHLCDAVRGALRAGARRARRHRHRAGTSTTRLVRGLRLLHAHDVRVRRRRARRGAERHRRRRPLRRAGRAARRARRRRASGSAAGSSGCCSPATPRACFAQPGRPVR